MQQRDVLNSPRLSELKRRRRKVFFNKVLLSLFSLVVIFVVLAYLSRLHSLNIQKVKVIGNKVVDTEMIQLAAGKEISGKYLWLFPKTNILFYPKNHIKSALSQDFKRLKDITLSVTNEQVLEVSVSEREAKYIWCGEIPDTQAKCSFLDQDGFIFDEAPYFSGEVYFKFYGKKDWTNFPRLISFKKTLEDMGVKPVALYIKEAGDMEVFLSSSVFSPEGPKLILKNDADFGKVAENLQAVLSTEPLLTDFKKKYSSLLYIDLRYGNKVYYKFR